MARARARGGSTITVEDSSIGTRGFSIARHLRRMLANKDFYLESDSRVLEFGCGSGDAVYEFRDAGLDAYGFEVRPSVNLRDPADTRFFRYALTGKPVNVPEFEINRAIYRIPFDNDYFDFVYSTSTFEHVMDYDAALSEIARVLRTGGVALHTFPARFVLVEPHIYVPLGGALQNYPWYLLWAYLGVRNEFQGAMGPIECARNNLYYARTGVNYMRFRDILRFSKRYFREAELVPYLWEMYDGGKLSLWGILVLKLRLFHWFYNQCRTVVLWLRK